MDEKYSENSRLRSLTLPSDIKIVVEIPIGSYGYIIDGETPENVVGLITRGIETCCGITMQTNNGKNIYFLAHITQATDIEDENFGLLNWIKICQEKTGISDVKNLNIEIHHGKNDKVSGAQGTDYESRIRNIIKKANYETSVNIIVDTESGDACLILRNRQKKELEVRVSDFYKIIDTINESDKRKKFIIESRNAHSKVMLNYLDNNKNSCTFMQPNGNELTTLLGKLEITLFESNLTPDKYQTEIIEKLFKTRTIKIPTGYTINTVAQVKAQTLHEKKITSEFADNPTIQVDTYPLIEYYSGKSYTNGEEIIKYQYRTVLKNQSPEKSEFVGQITK